MIIIRNCMLSASIDDLVNVKNALKTVNDLQSLGLELGLLYPTREAIEDSNRGQVEQCKGNLIAAWLKQKDDVNVPSWSVLKAAFGAIGEKEIASKII